MTSTMKRNCGLLVLGLLTPWWVQLTLLPVSALAIGDGMWHQNALLWKLVWSFCFAVLWVLARPKYSVVAAILLWTGGVLFLRSHYQAWEHLPLELAQSMGNGLSFYKRTGFYISWLSWLSKFSLLLSVFVAGIGMVLEVSSPRTRRPALTSP